MRAIIFANGEYPHPYRQPDLQEGDLVIAADGGSRHCQALQIIPDLLIGDLDSANPDLAADWEAAGVEVIRHPEDKDQTDLELALLLAQERGSGEALVYGAVGGRLDMTYGNLILLAHPQLTLPATLIWGNEEVHLLRPGEDLSLAGQPGDTLSLLPLHPGGAVVSTQGLQYALKNEKLAFGLTRGISNRLIQTRATIRLETGLMAVIHTRFTTLEEVSKHEID